MGLPYTHRNVLGRKDAQAPESLHREQHQRRPGVRRVPLLTGVLGVCGQHAAYLQQPAVQQAEHQLVQRLARSETCSTATAAQLEIYNKYIKKAYGTRRYT